MKNKMKTMRFSYSIDRWLTFPNFLTCSRIILTPCVVVAIIYYAWHIAFCLFFVAALTDVLDGYLARLLHEPTIIGAVLDPIADKILLLSTFVTLALMHVPLLGIPTWFVNVMVLREVIIVVGAGVLLFIGHPMDITPTRAGKMTTFFQFMLPIVSFFLWHTMFLLVFHILRRIGDRYLVIFEMICYLECWYVYE